jgi:hypothetical protein
MSKSDKPATREDIDKVLGVIKTLMFHVDDRFNSLEAKVEPFDTRLDRLTSTIDAFIKRLDDNETEQTARDSQFEKLLLWARKVSEKTGIPLENL